MFEVHLSKIKPVMGLNIQDVNDIDFLAFAGKNAGSIFEGEKRFDLVVRLGPSQRKDIETYKICL